MRSEISRSAGVPILAFHKVDSRFEFGLTRITPRGFRKVLDFLCRLGYNTVPLAALCGRDEPLPFKPVVLTFDDSYESLARNALPLMQERGYMATVFVITGYVGLLNTWDVNLGGLRFRHLSWDELKSLSEAGWEIGSHTVSHPDLTRIPTARLRSELVDSKRDLEDRLGRPTRFVSFPFGRYNERVLDAMRESGYDRGVAFWVREPRDKSLVFERKAYYLFDGRFALRAKLEGGAMSAFEDVKLRVVNFCSHGTTLVKPQDR
jgi:peptidoglycan/xylan/chitin deacetylase (PgdA/CDA1 family)